MGCDIHAGIERKIEGKWILTEWLHIERSYTLFSRLAGVRAIGLDPKPVAKPRGIPDEVSDGFKYHLNYWEGDAHSISWLTLEEMKSYGAWDGIGYSMRPVEVIQEMEFGDQPSRLVFFFDN